MLISALPSLRAIYLLFIFLSSENANHFFAGGSISPEIEKSNAISEVDGGPDLSRGEMNKQAGFIEGMVRNFPLSDNKERIDGNASLSSMPPGGIVASEEEKSFTFDVSPLAGLPEGGTSKGWQSVPHIQAHKRSTVYPCIIPYLFKLYSLANYIIICFFCSLPCCNHFP